MIYGYDWNSIIMFLALKTLVFEDNLVSPSKKTLVIGLKAYANHTLIQKTFLPVDACSHFS